MKKKNLLIILLMSIGFLIPTGVFADDASSIEKKSYYSLKVDYNFALSNEYNDAGNKKFTLYDKNRSLVFNSNYDNKGNYYYFNVMSNEDFSNIMPDFYSEIMNAFDRDRVGQIMTDNNLQIGSSKMGICGNGVSCEYKAEVWGHKVIPFILEEIDLSTNKTFKKIVFFTFEIYLTIDYGHNWNSDTNFYDINYIMSNSNLYFTNYNINYFSNLDESVKDNVLFMRNAVYDYSDELWEELNNGPIASSEMNYDNSSVVMDSNGIADLNKASVIRFNMKDNIINDTNNSNDNNSNKNNNIIDKITNPKTWSNGITILFISMLVIGLSSFFIIKRRV